MILNLRSFVSIEATRCEIVYAFQMNVASLPSVCRFWSLVASAEHRKAADHSLKRRCWIRPAAKAFLTGKLGSHDWAAHPPSAGYEITAKLTTSSGPPPF